LAQGLTSLPFLDGMNILQHIPESIFGLVLATLNPPPEVQIDEQTVQGRWYYEHPILDEKVRLSIFFLGLVTETV